MSAKFTGEPKDIKVSIRNKYNRRLVNLTFVLSDFIHHAEDRLDESKSGTIYKRDQVEMILAKCRELCTLLPTRENEEPGTYLTGEELERVLEDAARQTEEVLKSG